MKYGMLVMKNKFISSFSLDTLVNCAFKILYWYGHFLFFFDTFGPTGFLNVTSCMSLS